MKTPAHVLATSLLLNISLASCSPLPPAIQISHVGHLDLIPAPIPKEWIREGQPLARSKDLTGTPQNAYTSGLWECTAGLFEWHFHADELVHILEGEVIVSSLKGGDRKGSAEVTLKAGDVAHFSAGSQTLWRVPTYVKKLWVLDQKGEPMLRKIQRKFGL